MKGMFSGTICELGSFELAGPVMRVTDPCYSRDVWCSGTVPNCKVGTWESAILKIDEGDFGERVAVLAVRYADGGPRFTAINRAICNGTGAWDECPISVVVDSGQAGFFDELHYQDQSVFADSPVAMHNYGDSWYNHCCDVTLSRMGAGVIPYGVVSGSGYGDGCYYAVRHKAKDGQIDFLFLVFIENEDREDKD